MARTLMLFETTSGHCWVGGKGHSHCLGEGRNLETRKVLYLFVVGVFLSVNNFSYTSYY